MTASHGDNRRINSTTNDLDVYIYTWYIPRLEKHDLFLENQFFWETDWKKVLLPFGSVFLYFLGYSIFPTSGKYMISYSLKYFKDFFRGESQKNEK